jgi:hypothetical protein
MKVTFEVKRASVLTGDGSDKILLTVEAASPIWPFDAGTAHLSIDAAHGMGKQWLDENFPELGTMAEVIRTRGGPR